jgi:dipeptidyl aminopeptidase/acylaminoacyl peptidase
VSRAGGVAIWWAVLTFSCSRAEQAPSAASGAPRAVPSATASGPGPSPTLPSQPRTALEEAIDDVAGAHDFAEVTLSPTGGRAAWVESFDAPGVTRSRSIVRVFDRGRADVAPRTITAGASAHRERSPAFSPDGRTLAFVSDAESKDTAELFVVDLGDDASTPRRLTHLAGGLSRAQFSPDGKSIAVLYTEGAAVSGAIEAVTPLVGEVESRVVVSRLELVDVATGAVRALSRKDLHVRHARHLLGRGRGRAEGGRRRWASHALRLELRRLHDHVDGHARLRASAPRSRAPASRTGRATGGRTRSPIGSSRTSARPSTTTRRPTRETLLSNSSSESKRPRCCSSASATASARCRSRKGFGEG